MSDEVTVDVTYMQDEEGVHNYNQKFEVDVTGQTLRYKILVKDMKVHTILYNTGQKIEEVPFEEVRYSVGDYFSIP